MIPAQPIKKKLKGYEPYGDPLPVPVASITGFPSSASSWNYYEGIYQSGSVIVSAPSDISSLWHNGYFGQLKKKSHVHNEVYKNGNAYKHKKKWKLLESDGLQNASFFKNDGDAERGSEALKSCKVDVADVSESGMPESCEEFDFESIEQASSLECDNNHTENAKEQNDTVFKTEKNVKTVDSTTGAKRALDVNDEHSCKVNSSAELDPDCRTVFTFESDQNTAQFFNANNEVKDGVYLELSLEEAMFLSYALGCLLVILFGRPMTIDQMWEEFFNEDPRFVARYAVYHHYRSKGWVVKPGLKFGADYILYPVGPPFYHAQYTVMIQSVWANNHERDGSLCSREMSWTNMAATERLNSHVKKAPLICYVLRPRSLTANKLQNISCLKSLRIEEVILSRWDPNDVNNDPDDIITIE